MMRTRFSVLALALTLAAMAKAQTVQFVGVGSSAMFQSTAQGAFDVVFPNTVRVHHYTVGGAILHDSRSGLIPNTTGSLWVVWDDEHTQVWADIQTDSTVGNRGYFAAPRNTIQFSNAPATNIVLFSDGLPDDPTVPADIFAVLNNHAVTAAFTDIRPEDAKFAQDHALNDLGYSETNPIKSAFNPSNNFPAVKFSLGGAGAADPYTGQPVPAYTTIPVGAAPIVFIANATNPNGLGDPGIVNISTTSAQLLFSGAQCDGTLLGSASNFPVHAMQREPLSGTMNTTEFTVFQASTLGTNPASQETGVSSTTANPLNHLTCAGGVGDRSRAIGTGEEVNTAVKNNQDALGYTFFGYGNVSQIANNPNYKYLTLDGIDPISFSYIDGHLPSCAIDGCTPGALNTFPNLRNGTYKAWSLLRAVTDGDTTSANFVNTSALVSAAQLEVNFTIADYVPFTTSDGSDGLTVYRQHFARSGVNPNDGPLVTQGNPTFGFTLGGTDTIGPNTETGGDVGGCIQGPFNDPTNPPAVPGPTGCRQ